MSDQPLPRRTRTGGRPNLGRVLTPARWIPQALLDRLKARAADTGVPMADLVRAYVARGLSAPAPAGIAEPPGPRVKRQWYLEVDQVTALDAEHQRTGVPVGTLTVQYIAAGLDADEGRAAVPPVLLVRDDPEGQLADALGPLRWQSVTPAAARRAAAQDRPVVLVDGGARDVLTVGRITWVEGRREPVMLSGGVHPRPADTAELISIVTGALI